MNKIKLSAILVLIHFGFLLCVKSQNNNLQKTFTPLEVKMNEDVENNILNSYQQVKESFTKAYKQFPNIPRGMLEAISFNYTRFTHRSFTKTIDDAGVGMPRTYGVMGLTLDGQNYFRDNLKKVSFLSRISVERIINNPNDNVMAYAKAFVKISEQKNINSKLPMDYIPVLIELCELPLNADIQNDYAMNTFLYGVFDFLNNAAYAKKYHFPNYKMDLKNIFGINYKVLSSSFVKVDGDDIQTKDNVKYQRSSMSNTKEVTSTDYGPAIWNAAASCNYTTGRTSSISAIAVHYTAGSYSGCISWFKNCDAQASAHYVLRSSDGQITQMVLEANKAWHVRNENPYAIGFEHEAIEPVQNYFTVAMYQASAALVRDICASGYGISPLRMFYRDTLDDGTVLDYGVHSLGAEGSCIKIKGHQHFPNNTHTDPGPYWNWEYYYKQTNNSTAVTTYSTTTGTFTDDGGASANYSTDNRKLYLIDVPGASSITLNFTSFALETNYDFLYIYDGNSVYSPRIGRYNTISPGTVTSTGSQLLIEFRSDCATTAAGWVANWTCATADNIAPTSIINQNDSIWVTSNYSLSFNDEDNLGGSGIDRRFYQVMYNNGIEWTANQNKGFAVDNFDIYNTTKWKIPAGNLSWSVSGGALQILDTNTDNSNIYTALNGTLSNSYMYDFYAKIDGTSNNKRFGFHFACDSATLSNRGNSYFIYIRPASNQLEFYRVINNTYAQTSVVTGVVTNLNQYYHYKIVHNRISGKIEVFRDDILLGSWTDPSPLTTPSKYFSFRTARTQMFIKNMRVYRTRSTSVNVTVGSGDNDIPIQSKNSSVMSKVKSIVVDNNNNYSQLMSKEMKVDWTKPSLVQVIDGLSSDMDIFGTQGIIRGSWTTAVDTNSGIQKYKYAVGTSPGASNFVSWTDNGLSTNFEKTGLTLVDGTTYYITVKSQNGAGLWSDSTSSDGAIFHLQAVADFNANTQQVCTGGTVQFNNLSANYTGQTWYFTGGSPATSTLQNPQVTYTSAGNYAVKLVVTGASGADSITRTSYISVQSPPSQPSVVSNPVICQGSSAQISVSGTGTINWYTSLAGGTVLITGTSYNTPILTDNATYYVRSEIGSCMSSMAAINVLVEPMPSVPQLSSPAPICSGSSAQIIATGTSQIKWYNDPLASTLIYTGSVFNTPSLIENTTYFVRTETSHCITSMSNVSISVKPIPEIPTVNPMQSVCYGESIQLYAQGESSIRWYSDANTTSILGNGESYQTPSLNVTDTFFVRSELNGCNSPIAQIIVQVYSLPAQPIVSMISGQLCSNVASNNQWFLNSVAIDSAVNQCYTPLLSGSYTVQVSNSNGCLSPMSAPYTITGIMDDFSKHNITVFPNPTEDKFTINFGNISDVKTIVLYNSIGQLVYKQDVESNSKTLTIDLSLYRKGLYHVIIKNSNDRFSTTIVKD